MLDKKREIEEILSRVPPDRASRIASILATIEAQEKGINVQRLISKVSHEWGLRRETVIDYLETLNRAGKTVVGSDLRIRVRKR